MTVERHELRNRNTTSTVSSAPRPAPPPRCARRASTRGRRSPSPRRSSCPSGSVFCDLLDPLAARRRPTVGGAVALGLLDVDADRFRAVEERERARLLGAVAARRPPGRAGSAAPFRSATTSCAKSAGPSSRPRSRIARSSSWPVHAPDRRREVLRLQRLHHLRRRSRPRPAARAGRSSTVSSRSTLADDRAPRPRRESRAARA